MRLLTTIFWPILALVAAKNVACAQAKNTQIRVDFSQRVGPPLAKKFGVYQTPLVTRERLLASLPLLREIGVRDFRYEMGWGKRDVLAFDQISGTAAAPKIDFSLIDALVSGLKRVGAQPLLATGYCPLPLQNGSDWANFKDMPNDLQTWHDIHRTYAAHLTNSGAQFEIWNEPDMPETKGKMFFAGNAQNYADLYRAAAAGLHDGDKNAVIGGPAIAYDTHYLRAIADENPAFVSIHAYDNYADQIQNVRGVLGKSSRTPIFLTEYASFKELPANGPQSRHEGAMRFFRDVKGLLEIPEVTKVYWAQWLDAGNAPGMGLMTWDNHRKALFNAFKLYAQMPVSRCVLQVLEESKTIDGMASIDENRACIALWNSGETTQTVTVNLANLPFRRARLQLFRIDAQHASYVDNPQSEELQTTENRTLPHSKNMFWTGEIPAQSVLFLQMKR